MRHKMNNKKLTLKFLACLVILTIILVINAYLISAFGNNYILFSFDDKTYSIKQISIIRDNQYYFHTKASVYFGEQDDYDENSHYSYKLLDENQEVIDKKENIMPLVRIEVNKDINYKDINYIVVYKNNDVVLSKDISFCNENFKCEPCVGNNCDVMENYLTCPEDCKSGSEDYYCDLAEDKVCDSDCSNIDKDCKGCDEKLCYYDNLDYYCMYTFNGVKCTKDQTCKGNSVELEDETFCCVDSYCANTEALSDKEKVIPLFSEKEITKNIAEESETGKTGNIEKYKDVKEQNIMLTATMFVLAVLLLIVIGLGIAVHQFRGKTRKLENNVDELARQGLNYSKIKQHLVRRGFEETEIDEAINKHCSRIKR